MRLKHATMPLGEAASQLFGGRVPALCRKTREYFRDVYDHLNRIESAVDTIREMTITAIQVRILVPDERVQEARDLLVDAELGNWLKP